MMPSPLGPPLAPLAPLACACLALATFNVKDLLEPQNEDDRALLPAKLDAIARVVRACDADVVGLQEVGPVELLAAVLARLVGSGYGEPVIGTADGRGIRCALLSRLPIVAAQVHTAAALSFPVFRAGDPEPFGDRIPLRRGVVHARVESPGIGPVDVMVVHFKSALPRPLRDADGVDVPAETPKARAEGRVRSLVSRAAEALYVRGLVDDVLAADPSAEVAVVGDLNDSPDSPVIRAMRGEGPGELFDCAAGIDAAARFSSIHAGVPGQIDHVLVTAGLYARLVDARFLNESLRDHGAFDPEKDRYLTVDSDHAPLVVRFA
jgi:endonuclease/exonuclease/phosphatase family metal-dependent hydrolase